MFILKCTLICLVFNLAFSAVIEKYAGRICDLKKESEANDCLVKAIDNIFKTYSKGIREINLTPFNPLEISKATLSENRGGPTQLEIYFEKAKHFHIADSTIKDVKYDFKTGHLEFVVNNPRGQLNGTYKMSGKILALPISGHGEASITMIKGKVKIAMDLKIKDGKDNKKHLQAENVSVKITSGKTSFLFENLFGNKELSDNMNKFLNENDKDIMDDLGPALDAMYTNILETLLARLFATKPAEEFTIL